MHSVSKRFDARHDAVGKPIVAPTGANATAAISTLSVPLNPADPLAWVPTSGASYNALARPASGYPVSGTSQIILSQCYKDPTVTQALIDFLNNHYTGNASIIRGNGFDTIPTAFENAIINVFLIGQRGRTLNIGNPVACSGKGR